VKIYKYPLQGDGIHHYYIKVPQGARILHLGDDPNGDVCVWCEVPGRGEPEDSTYYFRVFGTGWPIHEAANERLSYFSTIIRGAFVFHYYTVTYISL
jgi:hypothetical protein